MADVILSTTNWTEVTGLTEGKNYLIQCINPTGIGFLEPFMFTQSSEAPTGTYEGALAFLGVTFTKGTKALWVKANTTGLKCHIEEV